MNETGTYPSGANMGQAGHFRGRDTTVNERSAPPARDTVGSALNEQEALLSSIHETLNHLEQALMPVLGPTLPATNGGAGLAKAHTDPPGVVQRISMHNRGLESLIHRLRDIGERLEL